MTDEIKELKKQVEELKKENTELQRELSVHNFLDTGVPQERLDYQRELKKEIIRLKSLCRRAADEIRDLDDTIIKITKEFPEAREFLGWKDDDLWAGEASINLLNRLDGRTKGGYVENYEDLVSEMKAIDGEQKEINKMVDQVESAAVKAAHKVMEQYSEAFEKLAENKE
jgi:HAMP domain-containing protein